MEPPARPRSQPSTSSGLNPRGDRSPSGTLARRTRGAASHQVAALSGRFRPSAGTERNKTMRVFRTSEGSVNMSGQGRVDTADDDDEEILTRDQCLMLSQLKLAGVSPTWLRAHRAQMIAITK